MSRSMTAFAAQMAEINGLSISWEIRSVNHRYLDISLRLADSFKALEPEIRAMISTTLLRGKIDCTLQIKRDTAAIDCEVNHNTVKQMLSSIAEIENLLNNPKAFSALDILTLPGVLQEQGVDSHQLSDPVLKLLETALADLVEARQREGQKLNALVQQRCELLKAQVVLAKQRAPLVLQNLREKIQVRISEVSASPDSDRLEQELVYLAQKLDVDEELDRLDSHIEEGFNVVKQDGAIGRRLDFLMQEMNREANTLASKSADTKTTQIAVEMKVLIEQMREQVQNIE